MTVLHHQEPPEVEMMDSPSQSQLQPQEEEHSSFLRCNENNRRQERDEQEEEEEQPPPCHFRNGSTRQFLVWVMVLTCTLIHRPESTTVQAFVVVGPHINHPRPWSSASISTTTTKSCFVSSPNHYSNERRKRRRRFSLFSVRSETPTTTTPVASASLSNGTPNDDAKGNPKKEFKGFGADPNNNKSNSRKTKQQQQAQPPPSPLETTTMAMDDTTTTTTTTLTLEEAKLELLELLPRMTGQTEEYRRVEVLVNAMESLYQPVETYDYMNLLQQGDWQLLFSTNLLRRNDNNNSNSSKTFVSPQVFRMRELYHTMTSNPPNDDNEPNAAVSENTTTATTARHSGTFTTHVVWDLADEVPGRFDCTGSFQIQSQYFVPTDSWIGRCQLELQDHILEPKSKQRMPHDCAGLVGYLYRALPSQLFDPLHHAVDTTYLDLDCKILRYTGQNYEGVRDIWIRRGAFQINPMTTTSTTTTTTNTNANE